jgi:hypothetical protein
LQKLPFWQNDAGLFLIRGSESKGIAPYDIELDNMLDGIAIKVRTSIKLL